VKKVLIVDDEPSICKLYAKELEENGYQVMSTSDGSGLIGMIERCEPDLVLLGIKMDRYDGLDILQDIRSAFYDMPVILFSAYSSFKHDLRAIAADYYVVKSPDLTELKGKINMALEGNRKSITEK
jgi:DNA-binding response OmpR family regulator